MTKPRARRPPETRSPTRAARASKFQSLHHQPEPRDNSSHAAAVHRRFCRRGSLLHYPPNATSGSLLPPHTPWGPPATRRSAGAASRLVAARAAASGARGEGDAAETVFFDGGAHYGDLAANLLLGLTLLWLPLTLAAVSRAFILRYRFTSRRVTVVSGLSGADRTDFPYSSVTSVVVVPRFIGEWGDIVITLKDGTKVDLRSVPRFREVADYCRSMAAAEGSLVS